MIFHKYNRVTILYTASEPLKEQEGSYAQLRQSGKNSNSRLQKHINEGEVICFWNI